LCYEPLAVMWSYLIVWYNPSQKCTTETLFRALFCVTLGGEIHRFWTRYATSHQRIQRRLDLSVQQLNQELEEMNKGEDARRERRREEILRDEERRLEQKRREWKLLGIPEPEGATASSKRRQEALINLDDAERKLERSNYIVRRMGEIRIGLAK
jgi:hypothetical protein